jgi:hypothetical protein
MMKPSTKWTTLVLCLFVCAAPLTVYHVARNQLPTRLRSALKPSDLTFASVHLSRTDGIQLRLRAAESAAPHIKELLTRITPIWSLRPIDGYRTEWLINNYTGSGIYWDDVALGATTAGFAEDWSPQSRDLGECRE